MGLAFFTFLAIFVLIGSVGFLVVQKTAVIALAAPVEVGICDRAAARYSRLAATRKAHGIP